MVTLDVSTVGGNGHGVVLGRLSCFQQEMIVWMNEDSSYLQEKVLVTISKVLSFAAKKVKRYVSHRVSPCHLLLQTASWHCCFPRLVS